MEHITREINSTIKQLETSGNLVTLLRKGEYVTILKAKIDPTYRSGIRVKVKTESGAKHWIDSSYLKGLEENEYFI
jgi:DNA-directed RNA polymerase beta' subunit